MKKSSLILALLVVTSSTFANSELLFSCKNADDDTAEHIEIRKMENGKINVYDESAPDFLYKFSTRWHLMEKDIKRNNEKTFKARLSEGLVQKTINKITINKETGNGEIYFFNREFSDTVYPLDRSEKTIRLTDCQ